MADVFPKRCLLTAAALAWLAVSACGHVQPWHPPNHREEGPERGAFTGAKGEIVIPLPAGGAVEKDAEKEKPPGKETPK